MPLFLCKRIGCHNLINRDAITISYIVKVKASISSKRGKIIGEKRNIIMNNG